MLKSVFLIHHGTQKRSEEFRDRLSLVEEVSRPTTEIEILAIKRYAEVMIDRCSDIPRGHGAISDMSTIPLGSADDLSMP